MIENPFPGPRPYRRAADRARFFGREELARRVGCLILGCRSVIVYGPSGAGKTSLLQIGVLPALVESDDVRVVAVDAWPEPEAPVARLAAAMSAALKLGEPEGGAAPSAAVLFHARSAARSSPRLLVVVLDHVEQVLHTHRDPQAADDLFECLHQLAELPLRAVRIVFSMREDYFGRLRDRLQDRRRLLEHTVRVGPLTVAELTSAACRAAAAGVPPLAWAPERIGPLMRRLRAPGQPDTDDAEAQLAYGQIVCRSLFQRETAGAPAGDEDDDVEGLLRAYLDERLAELGPLREPAERLLQDHLVTPEGGRTLRAEHDLLGLVESAEPHAVLHALEAAAVLQAREHDGARYLELGHDFLARRVRELGDERPRAEHRDAHTPHPTSPAAPQERPASRPEPPDLAVEELRRQRRLLVAVLAALSAVVVLAAALSLWAWRQRCSAEASPADRAVCR